MSIIPPLYRLHQLLKDMGSWAVHVYRSLYFPPAVICLAILVATLFGWQTARQSLGQDIADAASAHTSTAEQSLREHMVMFEQILHGGAGLLQSSDQISQATWENFLSAFKVDRDFGGMQGIGLIETYTDNELPAMVTFMADQGIDFALTPSGSNVDGHAPVLYVHNIEPRGNVPIGFDMYADPIRRASMLAARNSGDIVMTPPVDLLPGEHSGQQGFLMFVPSYYRGLPIGTAKERQAALKGYVFASFRTKVFFKDIVGKGASTHSAFYVGALSGSKEQALYQSPTYTQVNRDHDVIRATRQISLHEQTWIIRFAADPKELVSREQLAQPGNLLFFGVFSSILVSVVVLLLIRARSRVLTAENEEAVELAKDELLSLASHQLRTPATGVKQYVGMVLQGFAGKISRSQKNLLEKAYASNDRQLRIINEILHLAKIGSGRIVLAKQPTNLNELVTDIINEQRPDIRGAKHSIKLSLPTKPLTVYADTHMLRMAIENLLSNAIKYTYSGGKIGVRVYRQKQQAFISVSDTGVGIHSEDSAKIFRQFSRLPNEMSQQVGGTGIGLYLAKHLVELHKGSVTFTSKPGKGSVFTIALPLHSTMRNLTVQPHA